MQKKNNGAHIDNVNWVNTFLIYTNISIFNGEYEKLVQIKLAILYHSTFIVVNHINLIVDYSCFSICICLNGSGGFYAAKYNYLFYGFHFHYHSIDFFITFDCV